MNLSSIDLNLLLVLHAVLEEGRVTAAARRLHVTQAAVSNSLRRLRQLFGDPLLVRDGRGLTATPRAQELAPRLAAALREIQTVVGDDFDPLRTTRQLTLACSDGEAAALLPALMPAFSARLPRASLRVVSLDYLLASGGLAGGEVDVALGLQAATPPGCHARPLYRDGAVIVARRRHPRLRGRVTARSLSAAGWVDVLLALGRAGVGHGQAAPVFAAAGVTRTIALSVPTFTLAALAVATSDHVTGLPRRMAQALQRRFGLQILETPFSLPAFPIVAMWHPRTDADPAARILRELLVGAARPQVRKTGRPTRS
jgi:DNA-binding transcriptional LysR family regulator